MTLPEPSSQSGQPPAPVTVLAADGTRLAQLLASYETAKAAAEEAKQRFEALTLAIKIELTTAHPHNGRIILSGAPGLPRLRLSWRPTVRLNSRQLKIDLPALYDLYAVQSGNWELRRADQ